MGLSTFTILPMGPISLFSIPNKHTKRLHNVYIMVFVYMGDLICICYCLHLLLPLLVNSMVTLFTLLTLCENLDSLREHF